MKKSFTIIELIIYIGLFSMILVMLTQIITSTLNVQVENQTVSTAEQDSRYILTRLNYDIPRAKAIISPVAFGSAGKQTSLELTIDGLSYHYYLNGGNLMLNNSIGSPIQLNGYDSTITNLFFTRYNSSPTPAAGVNVDSIQVEFTLTSKSQAKSGPQIRNYKTTINLRCYSEC